MMKTITILLFAMLPVLAFGQTAATPVCPPELVCITREAALKAIADAERVEQLQRERAEYEKAISQLKAEISRLQTEYAAATAENSILKQRAVSDAALIEMLVKRTRPKKIGLINIF
ncbi:MAG: hypothetical protein C4287_23265 [Leptolyngbya sp. ERB_1_2]